MAKPIRAVIVDDSLLMRAMLKAELEAEGWWDVHTPAPKAFQTSEAIHDRIRISAGEITWERLYLSDDTPVRLVSGTKAGA